MCLLHVLADTEAFYFLSVSQPQRLSWSFPSWWCHRSNHHQCNCNWFFWNLLLPTLNCPLLPRLITSSSLQGGIDFYLWGCCDYISLREAPCQDCCFHHCTREIWYVSLFFSRMSKEKRKSHSAGQGKWKSPACGALQAIALLFRSLHFIRIQCQLRW